MRVFRCGLLVVALVVEPRLAHAQAPPPLVPQIGAEARAMIARLVDSARAAGLPTVPLTDKVAEGVLKGADDRRIVAAVQALVRQLGEASEILGRGPVSFSLLGATASALQAGVPAADLRRLVTAAGSPQDSPSLVGALVTLVDLIAKRVPPPAATMSIEDLLKRHATEDQFGALRAEVARDISSGQSPEAALATRTRAYVKVLEAVPVPAAPRRPPGTRPPM